MANRIYYEDLPHWKVGKNKGKIKWENVTDYPIRVEYNGEIYDCLISFNNGRITFICGNNRLTRNSNAFNKIKPENIIGIEKRKELKPFKYNIGDLIEKENLSITIIDTFHDSNRYKTKRYRYKCNICGFDSSKAAYRNGNQIDYSITESNLLNLTKCPCCHGRIVQCGINDTATTMPEVVKFFFDKSEAKRYSKSSNHKIVCVCPDCGTVKKNKISINQLSKLKYISCVCNRTMSFPERVMYHILNTSNVINGNFIYQYKPPWCVFDYNGKPKHGIYDFYFNYNDNDILIEMDGAFHYTKMFRDKEVPQHIVDLNKDTLAAIHKHNLIRIDCAKSEFDYIKENIIKSLDEVFLVGIDWNEIERLAISNLSKAICMDYEYHKANDDIMKYLENKYHLSRGNIICHLKNGDKYEWCNYNNRPQWKKVYQFDLSGNLIHIYDSCSQAIKESGISTLNLILIGKVKQRPPFIWSYNEKIGEEEFDRIRNSS
jgi:hypothetical protein